MSRTHARLCITRQGTLLRDEGSINGTYVDDVRITEVPLNTGSRVRVGHTLLHYLEGSRVDREHAKILAWLAAFDGLTGVRNRRAWSESGQYEVLRAHRYGRPLSLLILNLRGMRPFNAEYGFHAGDVLLTRVAMRLQVHTRRADLTARISGDHFSVILPEVGPRGAPTVAHKIRTLIEGRSFSVLGRTVQVHIDVACASLDHDPDDWSSLVRRASQQLKPQGSQLA